MVNQKCLGCVKLFLRASVLSLFLRRKSIMVHACSSCPADVTCSVSVTGNAASESLCLSIFVTCVYPDMPCTH